MRPLIGELDSIADQVQKYLVQPKEICEQHQPDSSCQSSDIRSELFLADEVARDLPETWHESDHVLGCGRDVKVSGLDFIDVKNVVGEL